MTGGQTFLGIVGALGGLGGMCGLASILMERRLRKRAELISRQEACRFDWQPTGRWRRSDALSKPGIYYIDIEDARLVMDGGAPIQQTRWRRPEPGELWFARPELEVKWKSDA